MRLIPVQLTLLLAAACGSDLVSENGRPSRTITMSAGDELELKLQTIGGGQYASPPAVSSASLRFISASIVTPYVPAGVTQVFRFRADSPGLAVITFQHTGDNPEVVDTVEID